MVKKVLFRSILIRSRTLPWMNGSIRKLTDERFKQLRKTQKQKPGGTEDGQTYKEQRNRVNKVLKRVQAEYWKGFL